MAKYVKCIQSDLGVPLTERNCYKVMGDDKTGYLIEDDSGSLEWWNKYRFEEPYDLPESITFSSQQEFEDAVMKVVLERLRVYEDRETRFGNTRKTFMDIEDEQQ